MFQVANSSTWAWDSVNTATTGVTYLDGTSLQGNWATDRVCPTTDTASCANTFKFIGIKTQSGLRTFEDGICGMWSAFSSGGFEDTLYVTSLFQAGAITEPTFSWYMTNTGGQSYIDFGTPDASIIGDGSNIHWVNAIQTSSWWANYVYSMKWGENSSSPGTVVTFTTVSGITDTGSSCIVGPSQYVSPIYNEIIGKISVTVANAGWGHIFWCSDAVNLPKFSIDFGGYWFEIT